MKMELVKINIIEPAASLLPGKMYSVEADCLLIAIGLQESGFKHRRQKGGGPARGYWQFERDGGVLGVMRHHATLGQARAVLTALDYPGDIDLFGIWEAIEHNDILACCFARLLLWSLPDKLPGPDEAEKAWDQYMVAWRPGKPHRATWDANYRRGCGLG